MHTKTEGIILQNIKYADKKHIIKVFTRDYGLLTFLAIPGNSPSSKIRKAAISPLSISEINFSYRQNKEIQILNEAVIKCVNNEISTSMPKVSIALFMNEILVKTIKEHMPNEELYEYLIGFLIDLNKAQQYFTNFHLNFLLQLSKFLGFEPLNNYSETEKYFDCREGKFSTVSLSYPMGLSGEQSKLFADYLQNNKIDFPGKRSERNELVDCLLAFYKMHIPGFTDVKTLDVLKEIYH